MVFNGWLIQAGHVAWSRETFAAKFADHSETKRHRVEHRRERNPEGLTGIQGPHSEVPGRVSVWRGMRLRTPLDHRHEYGSSGGSLRAVCTEPATAENGV